MDDGSFRPDGHGAYTSVSVPGSPSPAYLVVTIARRLLNEGHAVDLPAGYDVETLGRMAWILGTYDVPQRVSARQAAELRAMAASVNSGYFDILPPSERAATTHVLRA